SEVVGCVFSSRRRHTRLVSDWSSDVCSSDLKCHHSVAAGCFASCGWNSAEALVAAKPRSSRRRLSGDICPEADFDVVVEIFTQFSSPAERALKWSGMKRSLKSGGLLIIQGYTPKQLEYGTGGPKQIENLYTRAILERAFPEFRVLSIVEEECDIHEGPSHGGMSAVINLTATKP